MDNTEELQKKVDELSSKLEEITTEFNNFKNRINPDNILNTTLDVSSKRMIIDTFRDDILSGSIVWNPGSLADGVGETSSSITVNDAVLGDFVLVSAPYDLQDITATGYVQADDTVEIRIQNEGGATVDLGSGTWKILVFKQKYEN